MDPFFGGRTLDEAGLQRLLERAAPSQRLVARTSTSRPRRRATVLVRMLINLKWIHATRGDFARALLALDRIISPARRTRCRRCASAGCSPRASASVEAARADLSRLLELVPQAPDAKSIRARLAELRAKQSVLN